MNDQREQDTLMLQAKAEIVNLRRHNELLSAKVQVMDLFAATLFGHPAQQSVAMGEDIAWKIDRFFARRTEQAPQTASAEVNYESTTAMQNSGKADDTE